MDQLGTTQAAALGVTAATNVERAATTAALRRAAVAQLATTTALEDVHMQLFPASAEAPEPTEPPPSIAEMAELVATLLGAGPGPTGGPSGDGTAAPPSLSLGKRVKGGPGRTSSRGHGAAAARSTRATPKPRGPKPGHGGRPRKASKDCHKLDAMFHQATAASAPPPGQFNCPSIVSLDRP